MWIKWVILLVMAFESWGYSGEQSFTPTHVQFRIESIDLSTDMMAGQPAGEVMNLYSCTDKDCLVTLTDDSWLARLTLFRQIKAGRYRYLTVTSCSGNQNSFNAHLKGTVNLNDQPFITHPNRGLKQRVGSEPPETVTVTFTRCQFYNELQTDMVVSDSIETALTLFMSFNNMAWGRQGIRTMESGCFQSEEGAFPLQYSVCMGVPHMVPIVNESSPRVDVYRIHESGQDKETAFAEMVLFMSEDNSILGGFSRRLFSKESRPNARPEFDMAIKRVQKNSNGTYKIKTFGRYFDAIYLDFPEFHLNNHVNGIYFGIDGKPHAYDAVLSP